MNKKGFTLIELLAVILILAIIALITTPIVLHVLENSRQNTFKNSIEQLINIAKMDYNEYGRIDQVTYNYNGEEFVCVGCDNGADLPLDYTGALEATGTITYDGKNITVSITGDEFSANYEDGVVVTKKE